MLQWNLAQGEVGQNFEKKLARYKGTKHAITINSGTVVLQISLLEHGIGKGNEVVTTLFSFIKNAKSILYTDVLPVRLIGLSEL